MSKVSKIGFYSVFDEQMNNRMFAEPNVRLGDDLLLPFVRLQEAAKQVGIECCTADMAPLEQFDAFVFCEMPKKGSDVLGRVKNLGKPRFLLLAENYFIHKENADCARYPEFDAVFTYDDRVVDNKRVFKLNYAFDLPKSITVTTDHKRKLAVMICSNQNKNRANILYHRRRETIQWFEDHHPSDFDLYGFGWDRGTPAFQNYPTVQRVLRHAGVLRFFPKREYSTWKGCVERKRDVLGKYRFGFCYENTDQIPGYITEKIFDVMLAGSVPIYLGADNTPMHIPDDCFINRKQFSGHEGLYNYLKNMNEKEYAQYLQAIHTFLSTDQSDEFSIKQYATTLISVWRRVLGC